MLKVQISPELMETIEMILKRGNQVELKIEHGKLVVIEISRKLRARSS